MSEQEPTSPSGDIARSATQEPMQEPTARSATITSQVKTKSPGRVAAGKRLAEISKAARERKKQEQNNSGKVDDTLFTYSNIFALVGISIGVAALFYELYPRKIEMPPQQQQHVTIVSQPTTELESFD